MNKLMIGAGIAAALAVPAIAMQMSGHDGPHGPKGPVTRAEVRAKVAQHFGEIDTNKDGAVTQSEVDSHRAVMKAHWQAARAARRAEQFAKLDTNKDGQLSKSEFTAPRDEAMEGRRGEHRHGAMGGMHRHGMRGMAMGSGGKMWFERLDANKDGKVTLAEAETGALAMFDKVDANHDGTVTPEERRAAHDKMRGEWKDKGG